MGHTKFFEKSCFGIYFVYGVLQDRLTRRICSQAEVGGSPRLRLLPQKQKRGGRAIKLSFSFYINRILKDSWHVILIFCVFSFRSDSARWLQARWLPFPERGGFRRGGFPPERGGLHGFNSAVA